MSELARAVPLDEPEGSGGEVALTAGQLLRNAREAAGLHVAALAVSMKIPVKKLEALEADRLDLLHDAVFVRALASSVCRTLKIDAAPVLSRLPGNMAPRLKPDERGINAPFRAPGKGVRTSLSNLLSKPAALIVGALLFGALLVAFFPDIKVPESLSDATGSNLPAENVAPPVSQSAVTAEPKVQPELLVASSPVIAVQEQAPAVLQTASEVVSRVVTNVPESTGLVVFKARGPSWVKVVDANGVIQLSKTLSEGETATASGAIPLSVVVGRVDVTDVEIRGKAFSLASVARENVARFEVK